MKKGLLVIILGLFFLNLNVNATTLNCNTTLSYGSRGEMVKALQIELNNQTNCNLDVDGIFGPKTKECVITYQQNHNLVVDGIVGKNTCGSLTGYVGSIKNYQPTTYKRAFVTVELANVRKRATTNSKILGTVKRGTIVKIIGIENNWYKIQGSNNTIGYIRNDLVTTSGILLDISDQTLMVYEDGQKLWSTNVVTGNKGNHDTPVGTYTLKKANLQTARYLQGYNDDGSRYKSYVNYWMPFIVERGIGFHDASWRSGSEYTTETFKNHGSHGCVNMQLDAAEKLFNSIKKDTKVVVRN